MMIISIPKPIQRVLDLLNKQGYEAYIVGGCVRDSLLNINPTDWDVTTSARPEEMQRVFQQFRVIETGIKHGTLTVLIDDMSVEVTTYRMDGIYSDNRHPDEVSFTRSLREDLCRRDFTINALAYHPLYGIVDYFSGQTDVITRTIRCVGDPDTRFWEDALRIMRAIRFSSVLGFTIESQTASSLRRNRNLLTRIAVERIATELIKLLCGTDVTRILMEYPEVMAQIIPELSPMQGFAQNNPYHCYDVYEHTARSVSAAPPLPVLRLTMLFHDMGKPSCYTQDDCGIGHFYGHPSVSAAMAQTVLTRLKMENTLIERITKLVTWHDVTIEPTEPSLKRWLSRLGADGVRQFLHVKRADICAQTPELIKRTDEIADLERMMDKIIKDRQCFSLKDLQINGHDLLSLGVYPGKLLGDILNNLLDAVIDEQCPNEKAALLDQAKSFLGRTN